MSFLLADLLIQINELLFPLTYNNPAAGRGVSQTHKSGTREAIMCFFFSLIPATFWLVIGYAVLFMSSKADGQVQKLGRVVAVWVFVIAALFPIMGLVVTLGDLCPIADFVADMRE